MRHDKNLGKGKLQRRGDVLGCESQETINNMCDKSGGIEFQN